MAVVRIHHRTRSGVGKDADPAYIEAIARYMRAAASPSAVYAYEQMNGAIDTRPILSAIKAPTLVVGGTYDPLLQPATLREAIVVPIAGARLVLLDCGHEIPVEQPQMLAALLEAFVAGLGI